MNVSIESETTHNLWVAPAAALNQPVNVLPITVQPGPPVDANRSPSAAHVASCVVHAKPGSSVLYNAASVTDE